MASHKAILCWFIVFGIVGLGLHLAGFVYPAWIVMKTHKQRIEMGFGEMMLAQRMEEAGLLLPGTDGRRSMMGDDMQPPEPEGRMGPGPDGHMGQRPGGHMGGRPGDHMKPEDHMGPNTTPKMMMQGREREEMEIVELVRVWVEEVDDFDMSMHYGLWFSKMCFHEKITKEEVIEDEVFEEDVIEEDDERRMIVDKRDASSSSSSSSEEGHHGKHGGHHGKKCHCKKISTKCALKMAVFFESPMTMDKLSAKNMGHASLREHQIETTIGLVLFTLGVLGGIASFRKPNGCRCVKGVTAVLLLVAITLIAVPVVRLAHYTHYRNSIHDGVQIHCPISAVLSSSACSLGLLAAIVTIVGMCAQGRKERAGRWYQFNNELHEETEKSGKGPALEFYNDAYPVKAGLVEVCDFSDIKPQEEMEPEKKPLE